MNSFSYWRIARIAFLTILFKELNRFMRIWQQTLIPPAITMSLYFLIFGKFVGSQLAPISGYQYIQYLVPGLVLMSVMTNAYSNTSFSFFGGKFNRSIEELWVSPTPNWIIVMGYVLGGTIRGMLVGIIVLGVSYGFTHVPILHPVMVLLMAFLSAILFSLAGFINGVFANKFDDVSFVPTFILTPLTYLGGVFYSLNQLSQPWRTIASFNPILVMVDAFRHAILGISDLPLYFCVILMSVLILGLFSWSLFLIEKGIRVKN